MNETEEKKEPWVPMSREEWEFCRDWEDLTGEPIGSKRFPAADKYE